MSYLQTNSAQIILRLCHERMAADDIQKKRNANQVLLEATENLFSDKIEVKNLLQFSRELFSQEVLEQSLLSCCRQNGLFLLPAIISAGANLEVTDKNGNTPLLVCALYNSESSARCLIGSGANVNAVNYDGDTPLIVSVLNSAYIGITKLLVGSRDIKIDHTNNKGYTALLYAIETANFNAIKLLIDASDISGINEVSYESVLKHMANRNIILSLINVFKLQKATGQSPFLHAALERDLESAQIMISMDKSILNASRDSLTSVMIQFLESIEENNNVVNQTEVEIFEILLIHVTAKFMSSKEKEMIVDIVVSIGNFELLERLFKFHFIISYKNLKSVVSNPEFLCFLLTKNHVINKFNSKNKPVYNDSPLDIAMLEEEIESAKYLVQHGAYMDINQALEDAGNWNLEKALQFLISQFPEQVRQKLKSPKMLHCATTKCYSVPIVKLLIDSGADVNQTDNNGKTPFLKALKMGNVQMVECLIKSGADINFVYKITGKPLIFEATNETILKILLDNGVSVKPIDGDSPLNSLLAERHIGNENVKRLIDAGCDVNHVNEDGNTVLIHAAKYVDINLLELLVQEGADVNASGRKFPYLIAVTALLSKLWDNTQEATSCINYLLDHKANIDKVNSGVIHVFMTSGRLSLIPRFISRGLAPAYLSYWSIFHKSISPLMMALLLNQFNLARYFINIKYLMKSDIDVLYGNRDSLILVEQAAVVNRLDFLKMIGKSPLSLETLCLVCISDMLGPTQDRRSKVQNLELPQTLQNSLLFKHATGSQIKDVGKTYRYYFNHSIQQFNFYHVD